MMKITEIDENIVPEVYIYTDDVGLLKSLVDKLIRKRVNIVWINDKYIWPQKGKGNFKTISFSKFKDEAGGYNAGNKYLIIAIDNTGKINIENYKREVSELCKIAGRLDTKIFFVFPYYQEDLFHEYVEGISSRFLTDTDLFGGIIYSGAILEDPNGSLNPFSKRENASYLREQKPLFIVSLDKLSELVIKTLFSMSSNKKRILISGKEVSPEIFPEILKKRSSATTDHYRLKTPEVIDEKIFIDEDNDLLIRKYLSNEVNLIKDKRVDTQSNQKKTGVQTKYKIQPPKNPKSFSFFNGNLLKLKSLTKLIKEGLNKLLVKIFIFLRQLKNLKTQNNKGSDKDKVLEKTGRSKNRKKLLLIMPAIIIFILFLPFFAINITLLGLSLSEDLLSKGNIKFAEKIVDMTLYSNTGSRNILSKVVYYDLGKKAYLGAYQNLEVVGRKILIERSYIKIILQYLGFNNNLSSEGDSDTFENLNKIYLELGDIYNELGFLETESVLADDSTSYINPIFKDLKLSEFREKLLTLSNLIEYKNLLLGKDRPVKYVLAFQDDNWVRPTGGKLSVFTVITLSNGKIIDSQTFDTGFADSKMTGVVEAPSEMTKHLKKDKWLLEEANWYSGFPESAEKIEWFLDKELDIQVDGVFAVNNDALLELNDLTGKTNTYLNSENYLETVENVLKNISLVKDDEKVKILFKVIDLLDKKEIMLFINQGESDKYVETLGWNGMVKSPICEEFCYPDLFGIVETGIMKGSKNISREAEINVSVEEGLIKRDATYYLENRGNSKQDVFIRFLVNQDSGISSAKIITEGNEEIKDFEVLGIAGRKEAGIIIELGPHQIKAVNFSWESGSNKVGDLNEYKMLIRSQPGIDSYSLTLKIRNENLEDFLLQPSPALTDGGAYVYNTNLLGDFLVSLRKRN